MTEFEIPNYWLIYHFKLIQSFHKRNKIKSNESYKFWCPKKQRHFRKSQKPLINLYHVLHTVLNTENITLRKKHLLWFSWAVQLKKKIHKQKWNMKSIKKDKFICYKTIILVENSFFSRKDLGTLHGLPSVHDLNREEVGINWKR